MEVKAVYGGAVVAIKGQDQVSDRTIAMALRCEGAAEGLERK